jgi:hypothetical protein
MKMQYRFMGKAILLVVMLAVILVPSVFAIPESDSDSFRTSFRRDVQLDAYYNSSFLQTLGMQVYASNLSTSYYFVVRRNPADIFPYDNMQVCFICSGDYLDTCLYTNDYPSWSENGQISFLKTGYAEVNRTYNGTVRIVDFAQCTVKSIIDVIYDGNGAYAYLIVEMVPRINTQFTTIQRQCETDSAQAVIAEEMAGIDTVVSVNVNIWNTLFIMFQIGAVIFVVFVIPVLIFVMIKNFVFRLTGHKILERNV